MPFQMFSFTVSGASIEMMLPFMFDYKTGSKVHVGEIPELWFQKGERGRMLQTHDRCS